MYASNFQKAIKIIFIILLANIFIGVLKLYMFLITGSLAILAYLIDTFIDIMNDSIAFVALNKAMKPADIDHPYGHGKYEALSRLIISILVFITVFEIVSQSIERLIFSRTFIFINWNVLQLFLILILYYVLISGVELYSYKKTGIKLLEASLWHYVTDPLTTIIVFISLFLVSMGLYYLDIIASYLICVIILYAAYKIFRESALILVDQAVLDHEEIREKILSRFYPLIKDCHAIKTRSDGFGIYLDCHIIIDPNLTVEKAHELAHQVERYIKEIYQNKVFRGLTIHIEPEGSEFLDEDT